MNAMNPVHFEIDPRITSSCFKVADWQLSTVFLKNNADFPWIILVPREACAVDITDLSSRSRALLMEEMTRASRLMKTYFKPDKLNMATLGNQVSQLHIHIVARFREDKLWPQGIWQEVMPETGYSEAHIMALIRDLQALDRVEPKLCGEC